MEFDSPIVFWIFINIDFPINVTDEIYIIFCKETGSGDMSDTLAFNAKTDYAGVSYEDIQSMYYTFGVHKMEIGKALLEILDFIERELNAEIDYFDDGKDWFD